MIEYIRIGNIIDAHGIKGEVKIYPITDNNERFLELNYVWVGEDETDLNKFNIDSVRIYNGYPLIKFQEVESRNQAEALRKFGLFVDRSNTVKLPEGRYLICDLIGMQVYENAVLIGVLEDVMQTGANDVYVVKEIDGKELLLPVIKQCILNVDISKRRIDVCVMEGLRDDPI